MLTPFNLAGLAALWAWLHGNQQLFRWRRDRLIQPLSREERAILRRQRRAERQAQQHEHRQLALLRAERALSDDERLELDPVWDERFSHWIQLLKDNPAAVGSDLDLQQWSAALSIGSDAADLRQWLIVRGLLDPNEPIGLRGSVWSRSFPPDLVEEANRLVALSNEELLGMRNASTSLTWPPTAWTMRVPEKLMTRSRWSVVMASIGSGSTSLIQAV